MNMDVPTLMKEMAGVIAQVPGVVTAWDVPPNAPSSNQLPGVVLLWDGQTPTRVEASNAQGGTMWIASIRANILIARKGDTPQEFGKVRPIITPMVDAFAKPVREVMPALTGHVDRCIPVSVRGDVLIPHAGLLYMGAVVTFEAKFHRRRTPWAT